MGATRTVRKWVSDGCQVTLTVRRGQTLTAALRAVSRSPFGTGTGTGTKFAYGPEPPPEPDPDDEPPRFPGLRARLFG